RPALLFIRDQGRLVRVAEIDAELSQWGAAPPAHLLDDGAGLGRGDAADGRPARLDDAGLLPRDALQGVAQLLRVVEADARDDRDARPADVRGVKAAAQPDLDNGGLDPAADEVQEAQGRADLEEGQGALERG